MLVLGIMSIVSGFSLFANMDSYRGYAFRGTRDMLVAVLQKARSQSINNMCFGSACTDGKPHGVHFTPGQYVIFQGASWAARDAALDEIVKIESANVQVSGPDIVFAQLSGNASPAGGVITVVDDASHSSVISVNGEGQILWTN